MYSNDLEELKFLDSYDFQSEVLHRKILGRKVIYSAETQHIAHTNEDKSCHLQMLRVIQDSNKYKSILYWEIHRPELTLTGGNEDFVEWFRKRASSRLARKYTS